MNILIGRLDEDGPKAAHLMSSKSLTEANSQGVLKLIDEELGKKLAKICI